MYCVGDGSYFPDFGNGGPATSAGIYPASVWGSSDGTIYLINDFGTIRKINGNG